MPGNLNASQAAALPDPEALRMAIEDLAATFPAEYDGAAHLKRLNAALRRNDGRALATLQREALLANPLLPPRGILLVKRRESLLGLPQNWEGNSSLPRTGYDNEIALLSPPWSNPSFTTVYQPQHKAFVGDMELHFAADRLVFSQSDPTGPWRIWELSIADRNACPVPLIEEPDVDNYEPCYLPDGGILFASTAPFVGVPCVTGASHVSNLYRCDSDRGNVRRLTFEQDHNWCPTVLPNGRILYLRWEYSDIPHFASRILFHCNPDGTEQMEFYGSNSYWPNSLFFARPLPGSSSRFVAIVSGHHGVPRMGELVLFDASRGRREAEGAIQRIPGRGQPVKPILLDNLVDDSWPRFLHPWPLSDTYFLVSAKPTPDSPWGIYLVDVFDNMVLIADIPRYALLEPIPLSPRPAPPIIPSRVNTERHDALIYIADIYAGPGLKEVPKGTVKGLRLFTYHFAYHGMGGQINRVGLDGPWDIKRVLGSVPLEMDGSAFFRVPANTPLSVQPLDAEGKAIQLMRSWMTAMPGEILSCVGCHESQNTAPPSYTTLAARRAPDEITPWYGPVRGFSFLREVQPVLDAWCVACHNGTTHPEAPDFRLLPSVHPEAGDAPYRDGTTFPPSYLALRRHVRTPTMESDLHLLPPYEFHADTTHLVRLLRNGHHGVCLDSESWDRLITWIDLGAPAHGTWHEIVGPEKVMHQRDRRRAMLRAYASGIDEDPEAMAPVARISPPAYAGSTSNAASPAPLPAARVNGSMSLSPVPRRTVTLSDGIFLDLALIPAAPLQQSTSHDQPGPSFEHGQSLETPFWIGVTEVTNEQYACFDPAHDSRLEHGDFLQFSEEERGYPLNGPHQPVVRVSWERALDFCRWMSERLGETVTLPTASQWEYACRSRGVSSFWFGDPDGDFSAYANLADISLTHIDTFPPWNLPSGALAPWRPAAVHVNDGHRVSAPVGSYQPNPWGLYDMVGNVSEWTLTPCPVPDDCVPGDLIDQGMHTRKAVRGGSWYDPLPQAATAARAHHAWQPAFDVGFRIAIAHGTADQTAIASSDRTR